MSDRIWAVVVAAMVLFAAVGGFLVVRYEDHQPQACAGVEIAYPPAQSTAGKALDVFVTRRGGDPTDWVPARRGPGFVTFKATKSTSLPFASITVAPAGHGWEVMMGNCVTAPTSSPFPNPNP